ncbi:SGNH/GDSL hydrolase family protein [Nocardioides sp. MAHUQ-72]|uniref:SGNH/GDSL hydrolase family protein n=1 Tax=unclassified Nocardioides TaxID=2615069 RepID=UPI00360A143A
MPRKSHTARTLAAALPALAVLLALAATGCSGSDAVEPGAAEASAPTPSASVTDASGPATYARYVALGDSYTAAPLVPDTDVTNGCLRSTNNYPALVAADLSGTQLVDVSCSGADSSSMVGVQQTGNQAQPPQFDALTPETDLVTVGIGGNDFDLFATLVGTCAKLRSSDPEGAPCEKRFTSGGSDRLARELRQIRGHVAAIVAGIRDRAPKARVVVVGYPQILPPSGTCPDLLPLATGDYDYARRINEGLAQAVEQGARKADAFVDVFGPSAGHDICSDDPWINGRETDTSRALAFHPFAEEQEALARLVLAEL